MTSRDPRGCVEAVQSAILATAWLLVLLLVLLLLLLLMIRYDTIEEINVDSKAEYTA